MFERFEPEMEPIVQPQVGDTISNFQLLDKLGEGAVAEVFRAEHLVSRRQVALKVLHSEFCARMDIVRRFLQERQVVRRAFHPNILDITEVVHASGHPPFLIMELLHGEDLGRCLDRRGQLPVEEVVAIMEQVCGGLEAMHDRNIVHRDLKPANIFLVGGDDGYPVVKLLDFGLAKFLYEDDPFMRSRPGAFLGTPEYMAPEQVQSGEMTELVDVYAAGALLWEMLVGRPPFYGETFQETLKQSMGTDPPPPSSQAPDAQIPKLLDNLVLRCMAKKTQHRIQSISQVRALLTASLEQAPTVKLSPPPRMGLRAWHYLAGGAVATGAVSSLLWKLFL
jgi:serine/threonine protein kinase